MSKVSEPPRIPGYEVTRSLGKGSIGFLFEAIQTSTERRVLLKVLDEIETSSEIEARFYRGAEIIARLSHPNIAQVYEIDRVGRRPYLVMEHLDGGSLSFRMTQALTDESVAAGWVGSLAEAIHHAHSSGIIHRDLKPSGVLFSSEGEPKIIDFGLARMFESSSEMTSRNQVMGTPLYMSPEQASGGNEGLGPQTDIYSLGVMLYEMLTGQPPFTGANAVEVIQNALTMEPTPPSRINPRLSHQMESVCLKCLEKKPGDRFASAADLAAELREIQNAGRGFWKRLIAKIRGLFS